MKALFLSLVFLHLLIAILTEGEYEFGDIIAFPRKCFCTDIILYKHYALYVDGEYKEGDIIHRTKNPWGNDIKFGQLKEEGEHHKENMGFAKPEKEEIKKRIEVVLKNCNQYSARSNNCEHLATYLHSGNSVSKQTESISRFYCKKKGNCKDWDKAVQEMENNEKNEDLCSACPLNTAGG